MRSDLPEVLLKPQRKDRINQKYWNKWFGDGWRIGRVEYIETTETTEIHIDYLDFHDYLKIVKF